MFMFCLFSPLENSLEIFGTLSQEATSFGAAISSALQLRRFFPSCVCPAEYSSMSESPSESSKSADLQELFELLSQRQDGDLNGEETQRLAILEFTHSDAAAAFRRKAGELSCLLKQIPVCSVERLLFELPATRSPRAVVIPEPMKGPHRSGSQRVVVGAVTSLLCAGLLFALMRKTETTDSALMAKAEVLHGTMEARGGIGGALVAANEPLVANSMQMKVATDMRPDLLNAAAAPANLMAANEAISESSSEADVQPLIQSEDWNVVVVRIDAADRDQAMDQIQSIVRKAGLQLKGSVGHEESRWLGVVLTSNVAGREDVVSAMEGVGTSNGYVTETPPVDSQEALFIAAARESLKHPTRSELHYGKVFVALPSASSTMRTAEGPVVAATEEPEGGNPNSVSHEPLALPSAAVGGFAAGSAKVSAKAVPDVTLVVFEFSDGEKSGPNSSGQQI